MTTQSNPCSGHSATQRKMVKGHATGSASTTNRLCALPIHAKQAGVYCGHVKHVLNRSGNPVHADLKAGAPSG